MVINLDIKNILIAVLAILLFFAVDGCSFVNKIFDKQETVKTETKTETKTEVIKKEEKISDSVFAEPKKVKVAVKDQPGKPEAKDIVKEANQYQEEYVLPNGKIKAVVLTTGELLKLDLELATEDLLITKETTVKETVIQSGLYGTGRTVVGLDGRIKDVQVGVLYLHKNRWFAEGGVQYDIDPLINLPITHRAGVVFGFGVKF